MFPDFLFIKLSNISLEIVFANNKDDYDDDKQQRQISNQLLT